MELAAGGHLSHGFKTSHTGRIFEPAHYGVDETTRMIRGENPESFRGRVLEPCSEYPLV